jgi:large subunit ribosomal protein L25
MAEASEIKASARPRAGKGGARAIRREGRVPGVLYGDKAAPENIALDFKDLQLAVLRGKFLSTVHDLSLDGGKCRVIPREVQLDPVKDTPRGMWIFSASGPARAFASMCRCVSSMRGCRLD